MKGSTTGNPWSIYWYFSVCVAKSEYEWAIDIKSFVEMSLNSRFRFGSKSIAFAQSIHCTDLIEYFTYFMESIA